MGGPGGALNTLVGHQIEVALRGMVDTLIDECPWSYTANRTIIDNVVLSRAGFRIWFQMGLLNLEFQMRNKEGKKWSPT